MIEDLIKDITVEYLKNTEIGENINNALQGISKAQEVLLAYVNDDSPDHLKMMRVGTTITLSILDKVISGKSINEFDNQDWKDIANKVADIAILLDGQTYSVRIFTIYANYVDVSVSVLKANGISEEKCKAISNISVNMRELESQLECGKLSEVDYTEQCLWLLLEAMIKLICTYNTIFVGETLSEFSQSVAMLTFEYGRYSLYKKEQEIITQYLQHQGEVDAELEQRFSSFKAELQERIQVFDNLVTDAFSPDISKRLVASVNIARDAGVADEEILNSVEKIDEFFA